MATEKPITMESDTFAAMKQDMTVSLNRLLKNMQEYGSDKAALTVKLTVTLEDQELDNGEQGTVPKFEHKVSSTVQIKDETEGELDGNYILEDGGVYTVSGTVYGNIIGRGDIGLKIANGTIINGRVDLQRKISKVTRKYPSNPRIWIDYTCHATINNPDTVALQAGSYGPTFIEYCGTLTVNGNVSGNIQLTDGGTTLIVNGNMTDGFAYLNKETWLRLKGTIGDGVRIKAEYDQDGNEAYITNSYQVDDNYMVFYGGDDPW